MGDFIVSMETEHKNEAGLLGWGFAAEEMS